MSITAVIIACIALAVCGVVVVAICLKNQLFIPALFGLGAIVGAFVMLPAAMNEQAKHGESATLKFDHIHQQFITEPQQTSPTDPCKQQQQSAAAANPQ